jgi:hypothetical protein
MPQHLLPGTVSGFCVKEIVKKKGCFQSVNFCYGNRSKVAHSFAKKTHLDSNRVWLEEIPHSNQA